jgi:hypothetical protein
VATLVERNTARSPEDATSTTWSERVTFRSGVSASVCLKEASIAATPTELGRPLRMAMASVA